MLSCSESKRDAILRRSWSRFVAGETVSRFCVVVCCREIWGVNLVCNKVHTLRRGEGSTKQRMVIAFAEDLELNFVEVIRGWSRGDRNETAGSIRVRQRAHIGGRVSIAVEEIAVVV